MAVERSAAEQRRAFLEALFAGCHGFLDLRFISPYGECRRVVASSPAQAANEIVSSGGSSVRNAFVGVATRRTGETAPSAGGKGNLACARAVWVDFDVEEEGDREAFEIALEALPPALAVPSMLVASGAGLHGYWILKEPFELEKAEDVERFEAVLRGLADFLHADFRATDASRVLRVPGTMNLPDEKKRAKGRRPAPCTLLALDDDRRFLLDDFDPFEVRGREILRQRLEPVAFERRAWDGSLPQSVRELLVKLPRLRARWEGDSDGLTDPSDSALDLSIATLLAFERVDPAEIEAAIRFRRAHVGAKPKHAGYFVATVGKALASAARPEGRRDSASHKPAPGAVADVSESCAAMPRADTVSRDAEGSEWEPPAEFSAEAHGPGVPIEAFPAPIARYCEELANVHRVPLDFLAAAALAVLAAASAQRFSVAIGRTHTEPLNLYVLPVLPSGERKSVMRHLLRPLEEEERLLVEEARRAILDSESRWQAIDARVRHLRAAAAKEDDEAERSRGFDEAARLEHEKPAIPAAPRLLMDDATPEAMVRMLAQQGGRMMVASEEGGSFFDVLLGRYREGVPDLDAVLKAYDGGSICVDRATRSAGSASGRSTLATASVHVARPALTLLLTAQPALLEKLAAVPELKGRGFLARLVMVIPSSMVGHRLHRDCEPEPALARSYDGALRAILALPLSAGGAEPLRLRISGAALARWAAYHDRLEREQGPGGPLSGIVEWASKHAARAARIAALFHLAEHADKGKAALPLEIAEQAVSRAIAVSEWLEAHALVAFGRMAASPEATLAQRILGWLRRAAPRGSFTVRDAQQAHRNVERREDLLAALDVLAERGFVQRMAPPAQKRGPGRRPSGVYSVNPLTYRRNTHNPQKEPTAAEAPDSEDSEYSSVGLRARGLLAPAAARVPR